jgi:murein DD-endopeptidase MepM/ murein hydrolase activator NlpD
LESPEFLVINRDHRYLKEAAVEYAQEFQLEQAVASLYDEEVAQFEKTTKSGTHGSAARKKNRKKGTSSAPLSRWTRYVREPVFHWPLDKKSFWLSSPFGPRKKPDGSVGFHAAVDLAAVWGTPVKAAREGTVVEARYAHAYGNTIVITHSAKFKTRYAHLAKIEVRVGEKVQTGQRIGTVGDTGHVRKKGNDASHLHFEVYVFGKKVNPLHYLIS